MVQLVSFFSALVFCVCSYFHGLLSVFYRVLIWFLFLFCDDILFELGKLEQFYVYKTTSQPMIKIR